ncbi:undecaprenyl-diphosphatase UppP [bacterium]|nr:undecaprenyl-diphosphatase UppP [bacterium]
MNILDALILGLTQGLTEFLPVSSTGHLIIVHDLLGTDIGGALAFDAVLHLATALAVIIYFRRDVLRLLKTALRLMGHKEVVGKDKKLLLAILWGTVPAVVLGLSLESYIETSFRSPELVAVVLLLGSILFVLAERKHKYRTGSTELDSLRGFRIGLWQAAALLPGLSRSGATISGGMLLGLDRHEAARFAFLLAVPVILGAGLMKLIDLLSVGSNFEWSYLLAGALTAFAIGLLAIHFLLSILRKYSLWPFVWYRVALAILILVWAV